MKLVAVDGVPEVVEHPVVPKFGRFFAVVGTHLKNPAEIRGGGLFRRTQQDSPFGMRSAMFVTAHEHNTCVWVDDMMLRLAGDDKMKQQQGTVR